MLAKAQIENKIVSLLNKQIDVWVFENRQPDCVVPLSTREIAGTCAMGPLQRRQFLASRFYIKSFLQHYLPSSTSKLEILPGDNKRPYLAGNEHLDFNISHSGCYLVGAVSANPLYRVGIDLEYMHRSLDMHTIAKTAFNERDQFYWRNMQQSFHSFLRIWTAKEAYLKALGAGINRVNPRDVVIMFDEQITTAHVRHSEAPLAQLFSIKFRSEYECTVAIVKQNAQAQELP